MKNTVSSVKTRPLMVSYAGEAAVSAVSLVNQLNNIFILVFTALASGGAVVARRRKIYHVCIHYLDGGMQGNFIGSVWYYIESRCVSMPH